MSLRENEGGTWQYFMDGEANGHDASDVLDISFSCGSCYNKRALYALGSSCHFEILWAP